MTAIYLNRVIYYAQRKSYSFLQQATIMIPDTLSLLPFLIQTLIVVILFVSIYAPPGRPEKKGWKMNYLIILVLIIISTGKHWMPVLSMKLHGLF